MKVAINTRCLEIQPGNRVRVVASVETGLKNDDPDEIEKVLRSQSKSIIKKVTKQQLKDFSTAQQVEAEHLRSIADHIEQGKINQQDCVAYSKGEDLYITIHLRREK